MDTNKMRDSVREQFEKFALSSEGGLFPGHLAKGEDGEYLNYAAQCYWLFWQASREAVVVELGAPSHWVADYAACGGGRTVFDSEKASKVTDPMCLKTPAYTVHALEKAGLKVAP
ncbi:MULTISPECIES: hypothetical protein [Pseudomonas]|uniref:Uncharacterized protein n=1 Tax=Pseudomonas putida TaxID=303 RepID=A0A1L7NET4_PSEPU|nr:MULTISPECIES: hypothetical protein [Pseudomonas]MBP2091709.1 hypothetical protein [Pseudomonas sp. PvP088]MBP2222128.1 hypothetical protein [Pseudomonas putida]MBS3184524.1 hypothetical protein [Pseudomonas sp. PCH44]PMY81854.1 hypothetical protein C1X72_07610 [Pseudomonas sp. FW306-2-2C-D06B]BAW23978.1 Uncharacterized protein KF715C_ch34050 [Pseudomonas putida]